MRRGYPERKVQPLIISVIALATCLVVCLTGFALMYSSAREAAAELNRRNQELADRVAELENGMGTVDADSLQREIDSLRAELEAANADKAALQERIEELTRQLEEKLRQQEENKNLADKKLVALTFDDGPGRYTAQLLDFFKEHNVKATFFVIGKNAARYKDLLARMAAEGHEVGNHSNKHDNLKKLSSKEEVIEAIKECNDIIREATGKDPVVMRPPGGSVDDDVKAACAAMGLAIIHWQVDTKDWQSKDKDKILSVAFDPSSNYSIKDGSIVLMHDIYQTTYEAVTEMVERLENEGYTFVTVPELLRARGGMEAGVVYHKAFAV